MAMSKAQQVLQSIHAHFNDKFMKSEDVTVRAVPTEEGGRIEISFDDLEQACAVAEKLSTYSSSEIPVIAEVEAPKSSIIPDTHIVVAHFVFSE